MYHFLLKTVLRPDTFPDLHRPRRTKWDQSASDLEYSYFEVLTACLVDLARVDSDTHLDELDFLHDVLGLDKDQAKDIIKKQGFVHYRRVFASLTERQKMELLGLLLDLAMADQRLDPAELDYLRKTVDRLRLSPQSETLALDRINTLVEKTQ